MVRKKGYSYQPDYAVPPGATLRETIDHYGISQAELAERTGRPKKTINEIIQGKAAITPETALQFERVLKVPDSFWNNLERNYQQALARHREKEELQGHWNWLGKIPWREMAKRGWIKQRGDSVDQLKEVLSFFAVATPQAWESLWTSPQASFRRSPVFQANPWAVSAWLRRGEIEAQRVDCDPYQKDKFKSTLQTIRNLTVHSPETFLPEMRKQCAESGVAVVFVPELARSRVSGAARWLTPEKAFIALSLRHKSDDQFWFSFFHEAAHILLHGKREIFVDDGNQEGKGMKEAEADRFAADFLIPADELRTAQNIGRLTKGSIESIALRLGIAPGIIVGRLQHDQHIPFDRFNHLKRRLDWKRLEEILTA